MSLVSIWARSSPDNWTHAFRDTATRIAVFSLTLLPDFSQPRFNYLAEDRDARPARVLQLQTQMMRQWHRLGRRWAISMRIVKHNNLTLYLVFRKAQSDENDRSFEHEIAQIEASLLKDEYTFTRVDDEAGFDLSWANEAADIEKQEETRKGDDYPIPGLAAREYYIPYKWNAADNSMQKICDSLMRLPYDAAVAVTLIPASYLNEEREWMDNNIRSLQDAMKGERIKDASGRVIFQGKEMPTLRGGVESCEQINRQYSMEPVFLSSVHVFAKRDAKSIADALLANSVRNMGTVQLSVRGSSLFKSIERCWKEVDVSVDIMTPGWLARNRSLQIDPNADVPFRAQRLQRLVCIDEASCFFRFPIPLFAGFPGFGLDTGFDAVRNMPVGTRFVNVGNYLDEVGRHGEAYFEFQQFAKHGLIVGVPGSGKTTAVFSILHQLWNQPESQRVPFIVLEPAKTEYRALKTISTFRDDLLVFSLGDEDTSPFRFNPFEVLPHIRLESHISKLQACFVGAFNLFDPLPILLEQAIRRTYQEKGWFDDSRGGEPGLITPTLTDLCRNAEYIVESSGFDSKLKSDFKASLLERLNSLRRGSKGRMLDCKRSIPMEDLMQRPVILELDSLNGYEKSLMMMFLLSYVFEYCKANRKSGSPLKHLLVVEEAHNLIKSQGVSGDNYRADPSAHTVELFINMLAEMRALGQGILIADQLPTAIAPQAVKQTNVKLLMRITARDDREEIGNTMDLNDEQMHQVVNFKTGHAYLFHEGEDRVRMIRLPNFKDLHGVEEPPSDNELKRMMSFYESRNLDLYMPFDECSKCCKQCDRRTRNQAESFVTRDVVNNHSGSFDVMRSSFEGKDFDGELTLCEYVIAAASKENTRIRKRYGQCGSRFVTCSYIHFLNIASDKMVQCNKENAKGCSCSKFVQMRHFRTTLRM